ncbi:hypothetical protein CCACVL1_12459 [Corchorus capsularis]|uniref:Uncharacterized protein n=1 Tax=Corchorus capsularis TaxID=210143 RepID=A0A1R3IFJ0_COCAP|nr:hypothetical protein CCACVL1_12459 [Corchorus capsularis]
MSDSNGKALLRGGGRLAPLSHNKYGCQRGREYAGGILPVPVPDGE